MIGVPRGLRGREINGAVIDLQIRAIEMAKAGRAPQPVLSFIDEGVAFSMAESGVEKKGKVDKGQAFKMVFLGDSGVGKTCLAKLYVEKKVVDRVTHTIGFDHHCKDVELEDGNVAQLQIWDTAGMEQYRNALVTKYYRNADGIIFVYDITSVNTFTNVEKWLSEVRQYCGGLEKISMALVGNKLDQEAERKVSSEEGRGLADKYRMTFVELSAMAEATYSKLEELFVNLAREVYRRREVEMTLSTSHVIRLSDEWEVITAPEGPIPRQAYAHQDRARVRRASKCRC